MSNCESIDVAIPKLSIIIPTLNEAGNIQDAIASTQPSTNTEVIVVDAGSQDDTVAIAQSLGVTVILSSPGRAVQMNAGAVAASGDILLFLHADTRLPAGFDTLIRNALQQPGSVAGAFNLQIDASGWGLRLVEWGVKMRSHLWQMPYGDQAIFITKDIFYQIGCFPELPIMEDFELIRRLQRISKIAIIQASVLTSARRWLRKGIFKTTLINQIVIIAYLWGISPERIRSWYRQEKFRKN
ncbi:TIGR04283 family arsenosugar biosynthesis glycosyltransferase [Calothrix sp. FACHB-1219]|uniref:TIGR04283 family arsenosugar biosynthesis glycosyltransferase n=1 Tax=unclassified Calothrix TaxID=2619626 RepID=UPI0016840244|nr:MULTISPECIES: TIGR04283 family arsenosugar biosynthesis glycosyltransferase [unclassified Calothrix]MBD2200959.1 TIGR04283 family arsenosugar biosynthesis glycosyltransferase [Calothrix sp. FACHB-168]MBD2219763.1 TIGR04283 family arsenosugar biosynthesis glycosyltransferase [Calothrix sp. FACHB-1219]